MYPIISAIASVPLQLAALPQWVLWRWEVRDGKRQKVPYTIAGFRASSTDPQTWNRLEVLLEFLRLHPQFAAGVGFVVTAGDPFCGIDLDDCLTDSGTVKLWVAGLLKRFSDCYVEVTPSGSGLRIWCLAQTPNGLKRLLPDGQLEIYSNCRYFVVTGDRFGDAPLTITDHQSDIDALYQHFPAPATSPFSSIAGVALAERIVAGERHSSFVSIAGTLRKRGICVEAIEATIRAVNEHQCEPPMSPSELEEDLRGILRSAERWS
jgi:primase-polymerase (primpol)-like protein